MVSILEDPSSAEIEDALGGHRVVLIDFFATWCVPCRGFSPKFQRIARDFRRADPEADVAFLKVDIDRHSEFAHRHGVRSVPTLIALARRRSLFGGERLVETARHTGDMPANELARWVAARVE